MNKLLRWSFILLVFTAYGCDHWLIVPQENYAVAGPILGGYMGDVCENTFASPAGGCMNAFFHPPSAVRVANDARFFNSGYFTGYNRGFSNGMRNGYKNGFYDGYYHW